MPIDSQGKGSNATELCADGGGDLVIYWFIIYKDRAICSSVPDLPEAYQYNEAF